jgi:fructose-bisphosphate aldolase class II
MTLVRTAELVDAARAAATGVAALNVIQLEHAQGIVAAAEQVGRPVILQVSENALRYHGDDVATIAAALRSLAARSAAPVALHLDHATGFPLCREAVEEGFGSFMIDASAEPYDRNLALTAEAAAWGHERGVWVEAELGEVGGKGAHVSGARTDPQEAAAFVRDTGVDGLAVAIGSSHAMVDRTATLDLPLLEAIRAAVPLPLVLHGSSGVPDDAIADAVSAGITKVNVSTQLNAAMTGAIREALAAAPALVDPREYLGPGRDAVRERAAHFLTLISKGPLT